MKLIWDLRERNQPLEQHSHKHALIQTLQQKRKTHEIQKVSTSTRKSTYNAEGRWNQIKERAQTEVNKYASPSQVNNGRKIN